MAAKFLSGAALRICDPLLPNFATLFNVAPGKAAQVITLFAVAYSVMQLVFGPLGDTPMPSPAIHERQMQEMKSSFH